MKNARPVLVILISILVGVAAVVLAAQWVARQGRVATTKVVVAARDLDPGTRLTQDMLRSVEWPAGAPLEKPMVDQEKVLGRVLNAPLVRGEPILEARLAPPGEKGGLSAMLAEGKRAMTVKVSEIVGVAGFALPGNYVDLMVNTPDEKNQPTSKILLERILVLAVAQDASTSDTKPRVVNAVTLEVTPQQAEQIDLARNVGSISLVLRGQVDKGSVATQGARKDSLLGNEAQGKSAVAAATPAGLAVAAKPKPVVRKAAPKPAPPPVLVLAAPAPALAAAPEREKLEVIRGMKKSVE